MTDSFGRLSDALADRYRIERELGAGGMATVYLARDLRHDRPVAIKVLRPELAAAVGAERFLAEIKTTAYLQHAHILGLIDSGKVNGTVFYVMPFVDGESLRQRLDREKQLPVRDAVRIATDLAGALDYAHRRGIIHRDIKPANILRHEGQPLIADFGIALAVTRSGNGARITESGMSVGTPQYMSPEQAMGEGTLDARSDVYALGCVLYEMLTGEPPFNGPTAQAVIAKIMTVEPEPVTTLRRSVPQNVAAATMTALHKVPADRFATAADFAAALNNPQYVAPEIAARRARGRWIFGARQAAEIASLLVLAVLAAAGWMRGGSTAPAPVTRFEIPIPDSLFSPQIALSGDPAAMRVLWSTLSGYFERRLDSLSVRRVRDATSPAGVVRDASPDGRELLVAGRSGISAVPLAGGPARALVPPGGRGGSWSDDGYVYFGFANPQGQVRGIARVRAEGSAVDTLATTAATITEITALPGGRGLIVGLSQSGVAELDALDLRTRTLHPLNAAGSFAQFVEPRYLVFARGAALMAAPFDLDKLAFTAKPAPFVEVPSGGVGMLAARGNTLVYLPLPEQTRSGVVVRSRGGASHPLPNIPDSIRFTAFAVAPDGSRFVATGAPFPMPGAAPTGPPISNLFIYELSSGRMTRLRSDERDQAPAWMPNGRDVSFVRVNADTPATSTLMRRAWDGSAPPVPLFSRRGGDRGTVLGPLSWLPDGRHAIIRVAGSDLTPPAGGGGSGAAPRNRPNGDLMRFSLDAPARLDTVVATEYVESNPAVSPDGRVLAFTSDESGRPEVYIRPIGGGGQRRVSLNGGTLPRWAHSARELFYVNADTLFATDIRRIPDLEAGEVKVVFLSRNIGQGYGVLLGDTAFVTPAVPATNLLVVVTNVGTELARLFPRK